MNDNSATATAASPEYPDWMDDASDLPVSELDRDNIGEADYTGISTLTDEDKQKLPISVLLVYMFAIIGEMQDRNVDAKLDELEMVNNKIAAANNVYDIAAQHRTEAGNTDDDRSTANPALLAFAEEYGIAIDPNKEYSTTDWDTFMVQIQQQQNIFVNDAQQLTYMLEQEMGEASTMGQLITKLLSALQTMKERLASNIAFRA